MAEVIEKTRTNYFRTSDPAALAALIAGVKTGGDPVALIDKDGEYMFYCGSTIDGILTDKAVKMLETDPDWANDNPDEACSHGLFLQRLQGLVAPGDACIIRTIGYEGMRDLWADAYIVTRDAVNFVSFTDTIRSAAKSMLADSAWDTVMEG